MNDEQIKHMVNRFLMWKLPTDFRPDDGISFDPISNRGNQYEARRTPSGTNLFDCRQAEEMVRHMLEGLPGQVESEIIEMISKSSVGDPHTRIAIVDRIKRGEHKK